MIVLTLFQTAELFPQGIKHNSIKLNIFSPLVFWQGSKYKHNNFDYLGNFDEDAFKNLNKKRVIVVVIFLIMLISLIVIIDKYAM